MKKVCVGLVLALFGLSLCLQNASALPPVNAAWHEKYSALKDAVVSTLGDSSTDRCNVCHVPQKGKKEKNDYGAAVGKFVLKDTITKMKEDAEKSGTDPEKVAAETKKYILEGLQKAEGEKNKSGKTYGELIKSGKLPGGV